MKNSKRRGAVKVPNVILRPTQASSSRLSKRQTSLPRVGLREDDTIEGGVDLTAGNKPFDGIVLCATGDLDKRTLFSRAQELGAIRANDFTDQVTHLVADAHGSAKYKCAVKRNLPILKAAWVEEAYHTWLNGNIVDLEQTMIDHRLLMFSDVRLCITGMENVDMRSKIHALLAIQGGVYLKSLDNTATHLLCCALDNSPKIQWASEYNRTKRQADKISIVWEEWLWDSLEFGGRWDESDYEVTKPRPARKSLSQIPEIMGRGSNLLPTATLSQSTPLPPSIPTSSLLGDEPPEYGQTNKQRDVGLRIFESIVQKRCGAEPDSASQRSKSKSDELQQSVTRSIPPGLNLQYQDVASKLRALKGVSDADVDSDSVLNRLSSHRATSFACNSSPQPRSHQPFRRIASSSSNLAVAPQISFMSGVSTSTTSSGSRVFAGYTFRAFGEANASTLRGALEDHGGRWLTENEEQAADFHLVRLVSGGLFWREESDDNERAKYRTECWVERCIFEERICAADEHVVFTPLKIITPVEGSENLHLSLSGLDSAETCWTKRLVRAIGGNLPLTFSRRSTHLLCPSGRGTKYDKAKEWGVPVVGIDWICAIATSGQIIHTRDFEVTHEVDSVGAMTVDDTVGRRMDPKGKGKANDTEDGAGMIMDITNGALQESQSSKQTGASLNFKQSSEEIKRPTPDTPRCSRSKSPAPRTDSDSALPAELDTDSALTFGNPVALLSDPSPELSRTTMESGFAPSPLQKTSTSSLFPLSTTPRSSHATRRFSAAEIEQDKRTTEIPSSNSPSPLKIPAKPKSMTSPVISETRGLRTAITALLGKRGTEAREDVDGPQKPQGRSSKRPRLPSRVKTDLEPGRGVSPALSFMTGSPPFSSLRTHDESDTFLKEGQSGLRVVYEDPDQRAEKQKLIALFEKGPAADGPGSGYQDCKDTAKDKDVAHTGGNAVTASKRKSVRRSTRSSGI